MKKILLPVDEQRLDPKVFEVARDMALKFEAELVILHVQPDFDLMATQYAPYLLESQTAMGLDNNLFQQASDQIVSTISSQFEEAGIFSVSTHVIEGHPAGDIVDFAEKEGCDLIIMSTHGMGAVRRFLLGSVTNRVVHHATVPVMIIR